MAADFSKPTVVTPGASSMGYVLDNLIALAKQTIGSASNIPDAAVRINPANGLIQTYRSAATSWESLEYAGSSSGGANTYNFTIGQGVTLAAGQVFRVVSHQENTSSCTGTITSGTTALGSAKTYKKRVGNALYDITQGDIPNGHRMLLEYDGTYLILINPANHRIIDRTLAAVDVVSTATETAVWLVALKGNTTDVARGVENFFLCDVKNTSGSANVLDVRCKLGATTVASFTISVANNVNRGSLILEWRILPAGLTNSQRHQFRILFNNTTTDDTTGNLYSPATYQAIGSSSEGLTADKNMQVTFDWTTSNANSSARMRGAYSQLM